jgi:hypothetical protein
MSDPVTKPQEWYARPRNILSLLAILVVLSVLFARERVAGRQGDPRLSSLSADPLGARLFYELAGRLGWQTRRDMRGAMPRNPGAVLAVLDPTVTLRQSEAGAILQHVRRGGALFIVLGAGTSALADSLHITVDPNGSQVDSRVGAVHSCGTPVRYTNDDLWFGPARLLALRGRGLETPDTKTFVHVLATRRAERGTLRPSVVGMPFGAGRIVVAADPDILRNDALRVCSHGLDIAAVRALEYLQAGPLVKRELVFDEYHLGRGQRTGVVGMVRTYLGSTPSGHVILQLCGAGLLLLLAAAPRLLPPRDDPRVERRSPLEHVDALARAYSQVGATRTATLRLVRGLRRRVDRGTTRARTADRDELFLSRVGDSTPSLAPDIALVRNALATSVSQDEFRAVGGAIGRIEAALTRT